MAPFPPCLCHPDPPFDPCAAPAGLLHPTPLYVQRTQALQDTQAVAAGNGALLAVQACSLGRLLSCSGSPPVAQLAQPALGHFKPSAMYPGTLIRAARRCCAALSGSAEQAVSSPCLEKGHAMSRRCKADAAYNAAQSGDLDALGQALQPPNNAAEQVGYKDVVRGPSRAQGVKPRAHG